MMIYEYFLMDDKPEYDVFEFDDWCSAANCLLANASKSTSEFVSPPSILELKPLSNSLKYAFLWPDELFPVIIASDLDRDQEDKLIAQFRENKKAIGWTLRDIKDISPSTTQHTIHLKDNTKPYWDYQGRLNQTL